MTLFGLSKERYIATIASVALLVDFTHILLFFGQSFLSREYVIHIPVLLIIAYIGSYIGRWIVGYIPKEILRKIILIAIIVMNAYLGWQGWMGL